MKRSRFRNRAEYLTVVSALAIMRLVPRSAAVWLAYVLLRGVGAVVPKLRRAALRNFEIAGLGLSPSEANARVNACFRSLARLLAALARFPTINRENVGEWIRYEGFHHFEEARKLDRGVLFATGHLGNWELSAFAHALMSEPMTIVVRPLDNPLLDELATRYRSMSGNSVVGRADFLRPMLKTLARNGAVGILADQNTTADRGVFVDFFGQKACVEAGLARLAARTGAPVIPGFAVWSEREELFVLKFYPPVAITGDDAADTQSIQSSLEAAIREYPDQWLWIHRRWKTRPAGEPSIYGD